MLEGDVFVGDFGAGGWASTTTEAFFGGGGLIKVIAAPGCGACTASAGCSAFGAAAEHAEVGGDNLEAGALLAFLVLPFAGLDAAFDKNEGALL